MNTAINVLLALGVLGVVLTLLYAAVFEARVQFRNWRFMHRNPRPGYLFDRDKERIGL